ncbi:MAG: type IX secretion system protein PorQ [Bacteroidia bacterium]
MNKFLCAICLLPSLVYGQIGGRNVYDFLNLAPSARLAALGGTNVSIYDDDVNMAYQNPALLNDSSDRWMSVNFCNYLSDISFGYVAYSHYLPQIGSLHGSVQYSNYGKFVQADEVGSQLGTYSASDLAITIGLSRAYNRFHYAANLKFISSNISAFSSTGLAVDLGGSYYSKDKLFGAGIVCRNLGVQLSKYTPTGDREKLPTQLVAGISYKLAHMPLRFSVTATNLETPVLIFTDPNAQPTYDLAGNLIPPKKRIGDKIASHFIFSGEFLLGKNLRLRTGYNYLRRLELKSQGRSGLSGFSFGAGIRVSHFRFDYAYSSFGILRNAHQFSISTGLNSWKKK